LPTILDCSNNAAVSESILDPNRIVAAQLREIVASYGARALDDPAILASVLPDLLSDAPKERRLVESAAAVGAANHLSTRIAHGGTTASAISDVARLLSDQHALTLHAATWVVTAYAYALGHISEVSAPVTPTLPPTAPPPVPPAAATVLDTAYGAPQPAPAAPQWQPAPVVSAPPQPAVSGPPWQPAPVGNPPPHAAYPQGPYVPAPQPGQGYPPQHPQPGYPPVAPRKSSTSKVLLLVGGALALLVCLGGGFLLLIGVLLASDPSDVTEQYLTAFQARDLAGAQEHLCANHDDDLADMPQGTESLDSWRLVSETMSGSTATVVMAVTISEDGRQGTDNISFNLVMEGSDWKICSANN
jgi:hypothetical protein